MKIIIGGIACIIIGYKLISYDDYENIQSSFINMNFYSFRLLFSVVLFVPFNWSLEAWKWKLLLENTESISFKVSLISVLTGLTTGVLSPARLGEFVGRIFILKRENRKIAIFLWGIGTFLLTLVICICGLPAVSFLLFYGLIDASVVRIIIILLSISVVILFFLIPCIVSIFSGWFLRLYIACCRAIKMFSLFSLFKLFLFCLLRYLVFCLQLGLLFYFFNVNISISEMTIGIFASYFFVTFIPFSIFTDAVVKSSVFVMVIGLFSDNVAGIVSASMLLWILNIAIPTLTGVCLLYKYRSFGCVCRGNITNTEP